MTIWQAIRISFGESARELVAGITVISKLGGLLAVCLSIYFLLFRFSIFAAIGLTAIALSLYLGSLALENFLFKRARAAYSKNIPSLRRELETIIRDKNE